MTEWKTAAAGETEAQFRQFLSYLFAQASAGYASTGVVAGLAVAQTATASGSIVVGRGMAVVQPSLTAGGTPVVSNADKTVDVFTSSPMGALPRYDLVIFNSDSGTIEVVVGTPNASPTDPNVTANHVKLARLRHAANATTIPTSKIDDLRVMTHFYGSTQLVTGTAQRDALPKYVGLKVYRTDVKREETWDGTGWFTFTFGEETVTTNTTGDFSIATGLSSILTSTVENSNGGVAAGNRQNITVAKNAPYSGGNLTARIYAADTKAALSSATAGIKWNAWGYA
jgi:hypothetical protein